MVSAYRQYFSAFLQQEGQVWFATLNREKGLVHGKDDDLHQFLISMFSSWHHPIGAMLDKTDPSSIVYENAYEQHRNYPALDRRPITLVGDAAHGVSELFAC